MGSKSKRKRKQDRNKAIREAKDRKDKVDAASKNNWGGTIGSTFRKRVCEHPRIKLPEATGYLTGGKAYPKHIDLLIALDTWGLPEPAAYDTAGEVFPQPTLAGSERTIYYPVDDRQVPQHMGRLEQMLETIEDYLNNGKDVHIQCIGGHGRTGTILALLFGRFGVETEDYLTLEKSVHENYCEDAIESDTQRRFIAKYFDMEPPPKTKWACWQSSKSATQPEGESYYIIKDGVYELVTIKGDPPPEAIPAANLNDDWTDWENESEYGYGAEPEGYGREWYEHYDRIHGKGGNN